MLRCDWYVHSSSSNSFFVVFIFGTRHVFISRNIISNIYILWFSLGIPLRIRYWKWLAVSLRDSTFEVSFRDRRFTPHIIISSMMASAHMLIHLVISLLTFCYLFSSQLWNDLACHSHGQNIYICHGEWNPRYAITIPGRYYFFFQPHESVKCFIMRTFHLDYDYIPSDLLYAKSQYDKCLWILRRISPTLRSINSIHSFYIVQFIIIPGHKNFFFF